MDKSLDSNLISVIVPTYMRADRLPNAIDSILRQSFRNIEIIIVNDNALGSDWDKKTEELIARYALNDPRVHTIHTTGKIGGGAARNLGCSKAHGAYLAFLDDDDEYLPDKLETQLLFMLQNDLEMSWQDISWYDERGNLVEHRRLNHCSDFSSNGILRAHLLTPISPTSIYMLKRSLFEKTKGFGEVATGQDWWLMLRCIEANARIGYMPEVHVRQYLHKGDRLSLGENKIEGERARHKKVQEYYSLLSKEEISYVEFRHNAVLAFACLRSSRRLDAIRYLIRAICASPLACIREAFNFFIKAKSE